MALSQLVELEEEALLGSDDEHHKFIEEIKEWQWHEQDVRNPVIIEDLCKLCYFTDKKILESI